jgi:hypothetical protein
MGVGGVRWIEVTERETPALGFGICAERPRAS